MDRRPWTERWKPAAGVRTHLLAAALLWTLVGTGLSAAGVAWSRVHVGAHHASDVLGGITIGRMVGRVALAIWPGRR